jgi:hypothetical protein
MAKKKQSKGRKGTRPKGRAPPGIAGVLAKLDAGALAWRNLLLDPCGARLVQPCYGGAGTGVFMRFRTIYSPGAADTAGLWGFQLGTNKVWSFGTSTNASVTTSAEYNVFNDLASTNYNRDFRCIAGCVKVRYVGAESNRSGTVAMVTGPTLVPPNSATGNAVVTYQSQMPSMHRLGEVIHEVKFVPTISDEVMTTSSYVQGANVLTLAFTNIPANSLQIEVTGVYEVEAIDSQAIVNNVPPTSANTQNHVLSSLGPAMQWAYSNVATPIIKAAAGYASTVVRSAVQAGNVPMLTYGAIL